MKTYGIIMELNPFHNGHQYFLDQVRKIVGDDYLIAIISTNTVQRGEFSVMPTQVKTEILLDRGIDAVIAMPFLYTNQGGQYFGYHAVRILNEFGIDELICGSESGDLGKIILKYEQEYQARDDHDASNSNKNDDLNKNCLANKSKFKSGYNQQELQGLKSNDILGLSYYRASQKINPQIKMNLVKRLPSNFNENNNFHRNNLDINYQDYTKFQNTDEVKTKLKLNSGKMIASASTIRKYVNEVKKKGEFEYIKSDLIELEKVMEKQYIKDILQIDDEQLLQFVKYQLIINSDKDNEEIFLSEKGQLIKKLQKVIKNPLPIKTITELASLSKDKNNSKYKIQRICLNILFQVKNSRIKENQFVVSSSDRQDKTERYYILGFNERISKKIKDNQSFFTNFKVHGELQSSVYHFDEQIKEIKELGQNSNSKNDAKVWMNSLRKKEIKNGK